MPAIIIKDYEWRQTRDCVIVQVNVKVAPKHVDLFVVGDYLKAHFKPFILELFLWEPVNDEQSTCTIGEKELTFTLKKINENEWLSLEAADLSRESKREKRDSALKLMESASEEKLKIKSEKKGRLRREATQAQLNLQTTMLDKIEDIKNSCRKQVSEELSDWSKKLEKSDAENVRSDIKKIEDGMKYEDEIDRLNEDSSCIWDGYDSESDEEETSKPYAPGEKTVREMISGKRVMVTKTMGDSGRSIPLPREYGAIEVTFSDRVFVTPARESFKIQEEEWLAKQAKARRSTGFVAEDLRPEEQDFQWCQDKGEDFMKVGNYLGAISAFSHGIKLNDQIESLYIMRSAAHYGAGNYLKCIEDSSKALEMMVPECEANREARARCYARRGAALCQLSSPQHGLPEMEAALNLLPHDEQIQADICKIKKHFNIT